MKEGIYRYRGFALLFMLMSLPAESSVCLGPKCCQSKVWTRVLNTLILMKKMRFHPKRDRIYKVILCTVWLFSCCLAGLLLVWSFLRKKTFTVDQMTQALHFLAILYEQNVDINCCICVASSKISVINGVYNFRSEESLK